MQVKVTQISADPNNMKTHPVFWLYLATNKDQKKIINEIIKKIIIAVSEHTKKADSDSIRVLEEGGAQCGSVASWVGRFLGQQNW